MAQFSYHKPDLIIAPRPLKQSLGSPLNSRRPIFSIELPQYTDDVVVTSTATKLAVPSPRLPLESFEDKPEIRELYLEAEEELKEIVEGFTHTFVNNLMREGSQDGKGRKNSLWNGDDEDDDGFESDRSMLEDEYFSPFTSGAASRAETPVIFAMEDLPRLGGSPSPMPEPLSSDIRNYCFLDEEEYPHYTWDYYNNEHGVVDEDMYDEEDVDEVEEARRLFNESRWMTETPPTRASNPVCKNSQFGRRLVVVTTKNVIAPSEGEERLNEWRQRRKRIMSEPPQKAASFTSIECF